MRFALCVMGYAFGDMGQVESSPSIILIAAMSREGVIGTPTGMPWSVPAEYAHYLALIRDETVVMGRRTYEIFGEDLTSRHALVLSRSLPPGRGYAVYGDVAELLAAARALGRTIFVAGGREVYAQLMPWADRMYLSEIKGEYQGTVWFPAFAVADWRLAEEVDHGDWVFRRWVRV